MIVDLSQDSIDSIEGNQNVAENMSENSKVVVVENSPDDDVVIISNDTEDKNTVRLAEAVAIQEALLVSSNEKKSQKATGKRAAAGDDTTKSGPTRKGKKTMQERLLEAASGNTRSSSSSTDDSVDKLQEGITDTTVIKSEKKARHSTSSTMDNFDALVPPQVKIKTEQNQPPVPPPTKPVKTRELPPTILGGVPIGGVPGPGTVVAVPTIADTPIKLSESQFKVLGAILQRKSVFFTGAAGTGKSYVLRVLQDIMTHLKRSDSIAFTAPTGVAACNVRGLTIHSWSGIGLGTDPLDKILSTIMGREEVKKRWLRTEILVIDEISMLSAELFDMLSFVGSRVRNDSRPFGGIQLILCGDFFQVCIVMCTCVMYSISIHPIINTPYHQHTLSTHPIIASYQPTLSSTHSNCSSRPSDWATGRIFVSILKNGKKCLLGEVGSLPPYPPPS